MFMWNGEGGEGELENTDRKGGDNRVLGGECEWREGGNKRVKVAGVILLLGPVELTLTMARELNLSVSIHNESDVKWANRRID